MSDFASILSKRAESVEAPVPIPVGRYIGVIVGPAEQKTLGANQTPAAILKVKLLQPCDDVDSAALAAAGGIPERPLQLTLFLTEDAAFRLRTFLADQLEIPMGNSTLGEMLDQVAGRQIGVTVTHVPSRQGDQLYAQIKDTFNPNA